MKLENYLSDFASLYIHFATQLADELSHTDKVKLFVCAMENTPAGHQVNYPKQDKPAKPAPAPEENESSTSETPVCDNCEIPMRKVNGRNGTFWGCPNYRDGCRVTKEYVK